MYFYNVNEYMKQHSGVFQVRCRPQVCYYTTGNNCVCVSGFNMSASQTCCYMTAISTSQGGDLSLVCTHKHILQLTHMQTCLSLSLYPPSEASPLHTRLTLTGILHSEPGGEFYRSLKRFCGSVRRFFVPFSRFLMRLVGSWIKSLGPFRML